MELVFLSILILLMIVSLSSGFPVAFALPGSAITAITLAAICGYIFTGDPGAYFAQGGPVQWLKAGVTNFRSLYWEVERDTLIAIPLFVFMGIMLQQSKIAEDLLVAMARLFGPIPGGLGISVIFVGALLAATTGILGATVIAMGLISLPAMMRNNYSKSLASGTICASGTLGQIIPPSIVLIILADQLSNAADQARTIRKQEYTRATGEFTMPASLDITPASAGDMFMGALIPGLVLVGLYMLYILITANLKPETAPPIRYTGKYDKAFFHNVSLSLMPPLALIFAVLGSIIAGVATVNQAGAIGAVGAIVMGGYRLQKKGRHQYTPLNMVIVSIIVILSLLQFFDLNIKNVTSNSDQIGITLAILAVICLLVSITWSSWRTYKIDNTLFNVMVATAKTTSMVFIILIGAAMLTAAFRAFGGEHLVREFLTGLPGGFWVQFAIVMLVIFLLGFFLDFIEIAVVVVPIVAPILLADPTANITAVWLGVMIGLNIQTSFLTPPFGFALFYLRGVAPKNIKTTSIYKGVVVFIALQLLGLAIAGYFPSLVNYMPNRTSLMAETAPPPINPKLQLCLEKQVFADYLDNESAIRTNINNLRNVNLSMLPDNYRGSLLDSLNLAENTFNLVDDIKASVTDVTQYAATYKPTHDKIRQVSRQKYSIKAKIAGMQKQLKALQFSPQENLAQIERIDGAIQQLQQKLLVIENKLPANWFEDKERYKHLANTEKKARLNYRQNVDAAYRPLKNLLYVIKDTDSLANRIPDIEALSFTIDQSTPTQAMQQFKQIETKLGDHPGSSRIKTSLSKARRALNGSDADKEKAHKFHAEALALLTAELNWRNQAKAIIPTLIDYDELIKNNIGARLQNRLSTKMAKSIAACQSVHRDISLHF